MSFRWRLFCCLALAVLTGTAVEAVADYLELRESVGLSTAAALERTETFARGALRFENGVPNVPEALPGAPDDARIRVLRAGRAVLEINHLQPGAELATARRALGAFTLELAVDRRPYSEALTGSLRRDLTDDAVQVVLSIGVAWLLSTFLLRPVRSLDRALVAVSKQQFPGPLPVPPGDDVLAGLVRSFNRMSANIEAAFERERVFTRYASHELRTPLSAMKLQLEALELGLSPADKVVPAVQRNLDRMQRVLEALLSLARASEKNHEPVSLTQLVRETVQLLPPEVRRRVALEVRVSAALEVAQPYLIGQCVLNLVDNALKYSDGRVRVTLEPDVRGVRVRVADEGGGVPDELIGRLTHTFFRLSSHVEGSGLGLAFVKHIARTSGGELSLRNAGGGLEVALALPVVKGV